MIRKLILLATVLCAAAALERPRVLAEEGPEILETFGTLGPELAGLSKPAEFLLASTLSLEHDPFARSVHLGPIDVESFLAEDRLVTDPAQPLRAGVGREIQISVPDGQWNAIEGGGGLWTIAVVAEGAVGLRLHFSAFGLPAGAAVRLVSPARPDVIDGPFTYAGPFASGEFWTTVLAGEEAFLEYYDPGAGPEPPSVLPFTVDQLQQLYRDPLSPTAEPQEGDCHNDVTCYPAWSQLSNAVARFSFVENSTSFVCTGELLDTLSRDQTPYFLASAHCVSNVFVARTMVFYWRYQTQTCDGVPPSLLTVPTSSIGQLLAADGGIDYSLVMVLGELPVGLYWAGWTAVPVPDGTGCSAIHHPAGSHKRISFGTKTSDLEPLIRVDWYDGVTDPGSSGGGAFLDSTRQLVGILYGGPSSCTSPPQDLYDFFSAFAHIHPQIEGFLAGGSDDSWEPNATCSLAWPTPPGFQADLWVKSTDEDWYLLYADGCGVLGAVLNFTDAYGDIDLELYDACGGSLLAGAHGTGNVETLSFAPGRSGDFWLRVYLNAGARNAYDLRITQEGVTSEFDIPAGVAIPDNNPAGIQSTFVVSEHFNIQDLDVGLSIAHMFNGDLVVRLAHNGVSVDLVDRPGRPPDGPGFGFNNDGFDVILHDAAALAIESFNSGGPMVVGDFRANQALSSFNGQDAYGDWTLSVADVEGVDTGTLKSWALYLVREPGPPCECGGDGDFTGDGDADLADLAGFQRCYTGPGEGQVVAGCEETNFDCDSDVDLDDYGFLLSALTGPRVGNSNSDPNPPGSVGVN